ncbi:hypothetical protein CMUST_14875 [Corynebacterium mustelae]|uniref:Uncharacterized protein n=1 Tax=Corynebacterium mustelae TaxID=571915 RepID=A0A0G3H810_9CORY|nr:hypothetical protein [Corynebacterium mustelae]AKK07267.1 hypothetical protein CMUST_14875 [Corynebacterium mustelae]
MNLDAVLEPILKFFSDGIGAIIANIAKAIYHFLYPANADAATTNPTPSTAPKPVEK